MASRNLGGKICIVTGAGSGLGKAMGAEWRAMSEAEKAKYTPQQHLPGPGRHLQILDHTVHRIDTSTKANGEEEKEMVVSNLRHFNLKIGVLDPRMGIGRARAAVEGPSQCQTIKLS